MKVTVLKNDKKFNYFPIHSILMLILGIVLIFNAEKFISMIFDILGSLVFLYGLRNLIVYFDQKSKLGIVNNTLYIKAILSLIIGFIIIILSSIIMDAINLVTGISLLLLGLNKIINSNYPTAKNNLIFGIIYIVLSLYTLLASNVIFIFVGLFISINSIYDLITYFRN